MRRKLENLWLRTVRLYTFNTPIKRGKYRSYSAALSLCKYDHNNLPAKSKDGRPFIADLSNSMHYQLYFLGEFENALTKAASRLIRPNDICIDVGANFGWYTTLMAQRCGSGGRVHAFEPVPATFRELERNVSLSDFRRIITINRNALGDRRDTVMIRIPHGEPSGHASIAAKSSGEENTFACEMLRLDDYLSEKLVGDVNFVKVDIEGAEMMFLLGASKLFTQSIPPVIQMEMALQQTKPFGYLPNELIRYIRSKGDYNFYLVNESQCTLKKIDGFDDDDIGGNVFCIPSAVSLEPICEMIRS